MKFFSLITNLCQIIRCLSITTKKSLGEAKQHSDCGEVFGPKNLELIGNRFGITVLLVGFWTFFSDVNWTCGAGIEF